MASLSQIVSSKPKTGEKRSVCKEKGKVALEIDLYVVRWKLKRIERIAPVVVGHIPRQILRAICFFPEKGGAVTGNCLKNDADLSSSISKDGLEIFLQTNISIAAGSRKYLNRLKCTISENYDPSSETSFFFSAKRAKNWRRDNEGMRK